MVFSRQFWNKGKQGEREKVVTKGEGERGLVRKENKEALQWLCWDMMALKTFCNMDMNICHLFVRIQPTSIQTQTLNACDQIHSRGRDRSSTLLASVCRRERRSCPREKKCFSDTLHEAT